MSFSFNTALSGLNASSNALNVVGNNIANANTIGFRSSSVTFADVYANRYGARLNGAGNSLQAGTGVRTSAVHTNYEQGSLSEDELRAGVHAAVQKQSLVPVFCTSAENNIGVARLMTRSISAPEREHGSR